MIEGIRIEPLRIAFSVSVIFVFCRDYCVAVFR